MLALMERPSQVHDLYRQINGVIVNVEKMGTLYFCFPLHAKSY